MKVVILAGGMQSAISSEREGIPKPMIDIGGKPLLWHIMKHFSEYNLNEFIRLIIENEDSGIYHPQNKEYVVTSNLVKEVARIHNHQILFTKVGNPGISLLINRISLLNKVFGNQIYEKNISQYMNGEYNIRNFKESIRLTEGD